MALRGGLNFINSMTLISLLIGLTSTPALAETEVRTFDVICHTDGTFSGVPKTLFDWTAGQAIRSKCEGSEEPFHVSIAVSHDPLINGQRKRAGTTKINSETQVEVTENVTSINAIDVLNNFANPTYYVGYEGTLTGGNSVWRIENTLNVTSTFEFFTEAAVGGVGKVFLETVEVPAGTTKLVETSYTGQRHGVRVPYHPPGSGGYESVRAQGAQVPFAYQTQQVTQTHTQTSRVPSPVRVYVCSSFWSWSMLIDNIEVSKINAGGKCCWKTVNS